MLALYAAGELGVNIFWKRQNRLQHQIHHHLAWGGEHQSWLYSHFWYVLDFDSELVILISA